MGLLCLIYATSPSSTFLRKELLNKSRSPCTYIIGDAESILHQLGYILHTFETDSGSHTILTDIQNTLTCVFPLGSCVDWLIDFIFQTSPQDEITHTKVERTRLSQTIMYNPSPNTLFISSSHQTLHALS